MSGTTWASSLMRRMWAMLVGPQPQNHVRGTLMTRLEFDKAEVEFVVCHQGKDIRVSVKYGWMIKSVTTAIKTHGKPTVAELRAALDWLEIGCIDKVTS